MCPYPALRGIEVHLLLGPSDVNPATELDAGFGMACASGKENLPAGRRNFTVEPWIPATAMREKARDLAAPTPWSEGRRRKPRQNHATTNGFGTPRTARLSPPDMPSSATHRPLGRGRRSRPGVPERAASPPSRVATVPFRGVDQPRWRGRSLGRGDRGRQPGQSRLSRHRERAVRGCVRPALHR